MRLELIYTDNPPLIDDFIQTFQQSLIGTFVPPPTLKGNPTLRVTVSKPQDDDIDPSLLPPNLNIQHCSVFFFELFDTLGKQASVAGARDGVFRAYHCAFADGTYQMLFDDLPTFDGTASQVNQYAETATRFILQQLMN